MDVVDKVEQPLDEYQLAAVKEQQRQEEDERIVRLDALALSLSTKRKSAIDARAASGIEQIWLEDEDAYDGIDEINRQLEGAQGTRHRYTKSKSSSGTYSANDARPDANTCVLLPNITQRSANYDIYKHITLSSFVTLPSLRIYVPSGLL